MTDHIMLTDDELTELTGTPTGKRQCDILDEHGIFYVRRPDNRPRTTWYNVNHPNHLRGITPMQNEPDFGTLRAI